MTCGEKLLESQNSEKSSFHFFKFYVKLVFKFLINYSIIFTYQVRCFLRQFEMSLICDLPLRHSLKACVSLQKIGCSGLFLSRKLFYYEDFIFSQPAFITYRSDKLLRSVQNAVTCLGSN